jgi:hypothetical protein
MQVMTGACPRLVAWIAIALLTSGTSRAARQKSVRIYVQRT